MQDLAVQTPTYLFAAVNLLLLAYFNRFHALSTRIRDLATKDRLSQVKILRKRLQWAQAMIVQGVAAVALAVFSMLALVCHNPSLGFACFASAVVFILTSLFASIMEIMMGTKALDEELSLHVVKQSKVDIHE